MPELVVDIEAIGRNTEVVVALLRAHSLALVAVTKGCRGEPRVAAAMLAGGASALADTRDRNLHRLRCALPGAELHRIHLPSISGPFEPGDITYVSSAEGAAAVAALSGDPACAGRGVPGDQRTPRELMIMVETGDEREGVVPELLLDLAGAIAGDSRLHLAGLSTNYACFKGTPEGIRASVEAIDRAARELRTAGYQVERVSGGNSSLLRLLVDGENLPGTITELRCGEALLLGHDALEYRPLPGCCTEACLLRAEVVEGYTRPAVEAPVRRLVLDIGRQDLGNGAVRFRHPGLREVGRSSDYVVVEEEADDIHASVGATIEMIPSYEALVAAWTSPDVRVRFRKA